MLGKLKYLPVQVQARVEFIEQDAEHAQAGVVVSADGFDGLANLGNAEQAQDFGRHRDNQAVGRNIGVDGKDVERGRRIDDNKVIFIIQLVEVRFQHKLTARAVKFKFRA